MKIPSRGSVVVTLADGGSLDLWYNREARSWVLQRKDRDGNQTGPGHDGEASYHGRREGAILELTALLSKETQ